MKKFLLVPFGSSGDVHPFIALGMELKKRGHPVTVIVNGYFKKLTERAGLNFVEFGTESEYLAMAQHPDIWHPRRAFPLIAKQVAASLPQLVETIRELNEPNNTVVAASSLAMGARLAQEKYGIPTATIHLQPGIFRSVYSPPVLPGMTIPTWAPKILIRILYGIVDSVVDQVLGRPLNRCRKTLNLPAVKGVMGDWWHSPQLTIGFFPDWYFPHPPDWPAEFKTTEFPVFDGDGVEELSDGVSTYLNEGEPPVVITGGSAMHHDKEFFSLCVKACMHLGVRGVILARFKNQLPDNLPPTIRHFDYVPFGKVFPHAAAVIHHGGVGTVSQCFKAGRPQLIVPLAHDQFDNASRVHQLGAGIRLDLPKATVSSITSALKDLISNRTYTTAARNLSRRMGNANGVSQTCDLLEDLAEDRLTSRG